MRGASSAVAATPATCWPNSASTSYGEVSQRRDSRRRTGSKVTATIAVASTASGTLGSRTSSSVPPPRTSTQ
jgi:hypothetical protein